MRSRATGVTPWRGRRAAAAAMSASSSDGAHVRNQRVRPIAKKLEHVAPQLLGLLLTGLPEGGSELIDKRGLGRVRRDQSISLVMPCPPSGLSSVPRSRRRPGHRRLAMQIHATPSPRRGGCFASQNARCWFPIPSLDAAALVATASLRSSATRSAIIAAPSSVQDRAVMLDELCRELPQGPSSVRMHPLPDHHALGRGFVLDLVCHELFERRMPSSHGGHGPLRGSILLTDVGEIPFSTASVKRVMLRTSKCCPLCPH